MSDLWNCPICFLNYNNKDCVPKILINCGHTLCSKCLNTMEISQSPECPLDRTEIPLETIKNAPINWSLLQIIEQKHPSCDQHGMTCDQHGIVQDMGCLTDGEMLCKLCVEKDHKNHQTLHLDNLKATAVSKKNNLESKLKEFTESKNKKDVFFTGVRTKFMNCIGAEFDKMRNTLKKKEDALKIFYDCALAFEKNLLSDVFEKDKKIKEEYELSICDLNLNAEKGLVNKRVLITLGRDNKDFTFQNSWQRLSEVTDKLEKNLNENLQSISSTLLKALKSESLGNEIQIPNQDNNTDVTAGYSSNPLFLEIKKLFDLSIINDTLLINPSASPNSIVEVSEPKSFEKEQLSLLKKIKINWSKNGLDSQISQLFQLLFRWCEGISDVEINLNSSQIFQSEINHVNFETFFGTEKIENLKIIVKDCKGISNSFSNIILNPLKKMTNLKHLCLDLGGSDVNKKNFKDLCLEIKVKLQKLLSLNLNLNRIEVEDNSLFEQFSANTPDQIKLETFILNLDQRKINNNSIGTLAQFIPKFTHICELRLFLRNNPSVTDAGIIKLCQSLGGIAGNLRKLELAFSGSKITNKSINSLNECAIKQANGLEEFQIHFSHTKVNDEGMKNLLNGLKDRMSHLTLFNLDIPENDVTDSMVSALCQDIVSKINGNLSLFSLNLGCKSVTEQGLELLVDSFTQVLRTLGLSDSLPISCKGKTITVSKMINGEYEDEGEDDEAEEEEPMDSDDEYIR